MLVICNADNISVCVCLIVVSWQPWGKVIGLVGGIGSIIKSCYSILILFFFLFSLVSEFFWVCVVFLQHCSCPSSGLRPKSIGFRGSGGKGDNTRPCIYTFLYGWRSELCEAPKNFKWVHPFFFYLNIPINALCILVPMSDWWSQLDMDAKISSVRFFYIYISI